MTSEMSGADDSRQDVVLLGFQNLPTDSFTAHLQQLSDESTTAVWMARDGMVRV